MAKFGIFLDYYGDGKYVGYLVERPTAWGTTFKTTDLTPNEAIAFKNEAAAKHTLEEVVKSTWLLSYPDHTMSVVRLPE